MDNTIDGKMEVEKSTLGQRRNKNWHSVSVGDQKIILTTILGGKAVDGVISLGLGTDVAREGIGGEGAGVATVLVNTANVDLDRGVVLGANKAVSGRATNEKKK